MPFKVIPSGFGRILHAVQLTVRVETLQDGGPGTYVTCTVDSGATSCIFDATVASRLGLEFRAGKPTMTLGVGGQVQTYLHEVRLQLPGGPVTVLAGFQENLPVLGLLGMSGFFEHFRITFDGTAKVCEFDRIQKP